ncbi:hypothetical protein F4778DRAFT_457434 [Xylariomycetidae sp. FL2044]|nr:hypothetical protein F4778DRAFT_457434 [Xylariomycetidae sp. FL2044]
MAPNAPLKADFNIHYDVTSDRDDYSLRPHSTVNHNQHTALRDLPATKLQSRRSSLDSDSTVESITSDLEKLTLGAGDHQVSRVKADSNWHSKPRKHAGSRLTRPPITNNTFAVLETVTEDESQTTVSATDSVTESAATTVADTAPRYIQLSCPQRSEHPLAIAARGIPPVDVQVAKHRDENFEWLVTLRLPVKSTSKCDSNTGSGSVQFKNLFLGCNLLSVRRPPPSVQSAGDCALETYTLLATPLEGEEAPIEITSETGAEEVMASNADPATPVKEPTSPAADDLQEITPMSINHTEENDTSVEVIPSSTPPQSTARIEDSVAALDELEEQLEAFDEAAHFEELLSPGKEKSGAKQSRRSVGTVRFATPQANRTPPMKASSGSVRVKSMSEPRRPSLRKSASLEFLDVPKPKSQENLASQEEQRKTPPTKVASLKPPKQLAKSTKQPTLPTFELPGEAVARKLKEQREARLSAQPTTERIMKPTASSLRRTKSARAPTIPNFELPGEAISRRKREEREAQLKAEEEEQRKRREFKARPIGVGTGTKSTPRETISSRARQNKVTTAENFQRQVTLGSNKRASLAGYPNSRPPLSNANNQLGPRGRALQLESSDAQKDRAESASTGSLSGKRSSLSVEESQQQKLRGQQIFQRDNSWTGDRDREKKEREAHAKLARAEAAERSRQQSREWAAKQARKRMTVSSIREVMG